MLVIGWHDHASDREFRAGASIASSQVGPRLRQLSVRQALGPDDEVLEPLLHCRPARDRRTPHDADDLLELRQRWWPRWVLPSNMAQHGLECFFFDGVDGVAPVLRCLQTELALHHIGAIPRAEPFPGLSCLPANFSLSHRSPPSSDPTHLSLAVRCHWAEVEVAE